MNHSSLFILLACVASICYCKPKNASEQSLSPPNLTEIGSLPDPNPTVVPSGEWNIEQSGPFSVILSNPKANGSLIIQMVEGEGALDKVTDEIVELLCNKMQVEKPSIVKVDFQNQPASQFVLEHKTKKYHHLVFMRKNTPFMVSLQSPLKSYSEVLKTATPVFNSLKLYGQ